MIRKSKRITGKFWIWIKHCISQELPTLTQNGKKRDKDTPKRGSDGETDVLVLTPFH